MLQVTEDIHPYRCLRPLGHVILNIPLYEMYNFEAIAKDKPTNPSFNDGVKCSQILGGGVSMRTGQWIEVTACRINQKRMNYITNYLFHT